MNFLKRFALNLKRYWFIFAIALWIFIIAAIRITVNDGLFCDYIIRENGQPVGIRILEHYVPWEERRDEFFFRSIYEEYEDGECLTENEVKFRLTYLPVYTTLVLVVTVLAFTIGQVQRERRNELKKLKRKPKEY